MKWLDGLLVPHRVTPNIKFAGPLLYTWTERGSMRVKCLAEDHTPVPQPGLAPVPPDPESSALTIRPPCRPPWGCGQPKYLSSCIIENVTAAGRHGWPPCAYACAYFNPVLTWHKRDISISTSRHKKKKHVRFLMLMLMLMSRVFSLAYAYVMLMLVLMLMR